MKRAIFMKCSISQIFNSEMRGFLLLSIFLLLAQQIVAPPVTKTHEVEEKKNETHEEVKDEMTFEYDRYLQEVIKALETDKHFREKLDKADEDYIRSGKIAKELEFVHHRVRSKLDELKRTELERLKQLHFKKQQLGESKFPKEAHHLDHTNEHTFEIEDLKKLIHKTNQDLAEADRRRKQEFKEYEMQKKFEEEQKMKGLNEEEKKKYAAELEAMKEKHKKHQPLHHPGSKQQLEEVWEKQDHMEDQDFNPVTFFYTHDVDGNGVWDQDEVEALFVKELDKMYNGNPEDDPREREEEMERMREHMFSEADTNQDGFIDYQEFLAQTKRNDFQEDPGWKSLDEQELYSQQEYNAYEIQKQQEIQKMIAQGLFPPQHFDPNQAHHPGQVPPAHQQQHQGQVPVQQQQYQGQVPVQQQYPGQVPVQQQQYQGQVPVQQQHQVPVQNQQPGQVQGQVPVQQQQNQVPVQSQQPGHPQGQYQVPQIPQGQQPLQQQYQPPPQQVPHNQVPPVVNNQHVQDNAIPVGNQQHQPVQTQNIANQQPPQPSGQAQPVNPIHNAPPNVVHA
ncbi:nucleobindin-2 isoform X2 [Diachasma alloeum]|uniref:nucleobindin-2 isoform X2 n=1 Tax=Diachasma alloeum TaxID=454923 RepID=UPI0007382300|nr:nucleobindin-2 isoform X2 [Diachasma alloeum]